MRTIAFGAMVAMGLIVAATDARADDEKMTLKDAPKAVQAAVKKHFPDAKVKNVSKETEDGETIYEVEMIVNGKTVDVNFDDEGEAEVIEKEIEVADLPRAVAKAIKQKYADAKVEKVEEVTEEDNKVTYEITFKEKGEKSVQVVFAANGKVVKNDDKEEGDEKGEKKGKKDKKGDKDDDDKDEKRPKG